MAPHTAATLRKLGDVRPDSPPERATARQRLVGWPDKGPLEDRRRRGQDERRSRMHELALCQAIVDTVERHADGRRVEQVDVRIGHFRQVVPDSLQFSWELLTEGTDLAGCRLVIDHVPAVIKCRACGSATTLEVPILVCSACEGSDVTLVSGEELLVASIDRAREAS
jgi:hydrogenase nickel incorporation protein HypA/HybF